MTPTRIMTIAFSFKNPDTATRFRYLPGWVSGSFALAGVVKNPDPNTL
jgi:hypothetical protein